MDRLKFSIDSGSNKLRSVKSHHQIFLLLCLMIAALFFNGCEKHRSDHPILVLGFDGFEWDIILPVLKKGRLPNIARLMMHGYYGTIETLTPTRSPILWTTIATGKVYEKHGIYGFFRRMSNSKEKKQDKTVNLVQSSDRKTKALWNILSDYNKSVWSIGWWITFPVEEINGVMISQTNALPKLNIPKGKNVEAWKGMLLKGIEGQIYPPHLENKMTAILNDTEEELPALIKQIFGKFYFPLSVLGKRLWDNCWSALRADATYYRILDELSQQGQLPDLTLLYFGGTDEVGHRFLRYMRPELYLHKPAKEQISNFGKIIEDYYAHCDWIVGQLMETYGPDTTLFIISDHGMNPVNLTAEFNLKNPGSASISGGHKMKPPGFFLASGPYIREIPTTQSLKTLTRKDLENVCDILDITPTILTMKGIPIGKDMDGKVISKIFHEKFRFDLQPPAVDTHDTSEFLTLQKERKKKRIIGLDEKKRLEQLHSLGYIED